MVGRPSSDRRTQPRCAARLPSRDDAEGALAGDRVCCSPCRAATPATVTSRRGCVDEAHEAGGRAVAAATATAWRQVAIVLRVGEDLGGEHDVVRVRGAEPLHGVPSPLPIVAAIFASARSRATCRRPGRCRPSSVTEPRSCGSMRSTFMASWFDQSDAPLRHCRVLGFSSTPTKSAPQATGDDARGPAAGEGVQHSAALGTASQHAGFDQLLREVAKCLAKGCVAIVHGRGGLRTMDGSRLTP